MAQRVKGPGAGDKEGRPVSRRSFLRGALGLSLAITGAGVIFPVMGYLWPPRGAAGSSGGRVLAGTTGDIPVGKGKVVSFQGKPVIVLNTQEGVKAFSAICTHLGCIVTWREDGGFIYCPCHDGRFDINGQVISGPPPRPLDPVPVALEGDQIYLGGA